MTRARLIHGAVTAAIGAGAYAGCAVAAAVSGFPPPVSWVVVLGLLWVLAGAIDGAAEVGALARRVLLRVWAWRRDREAVALAAAYEASGVIYRYGSPPTHAAGRAA